MLRRPDDRTLLEDMLAQVQGIMTEQAASPATPKAALIRLAAVRCAVLVTSAKQGRLSRHEAERRQARRRRWQGLAAVALVALAGIGGWLALG